MILFDYEPNWKSKPKIDYGFLTVVTATRKNKEQRKGLYSTMRRSIAYTVDVAENAARVMNSLQAGNVIAHYVPVVSEALLPVGAGNLNGLTTITVNDFSYYFNLKTLTDEIMLIDLTGAEPSEVIAIDSLLSPAINLAVAVAGTFPIATTVIYPVMIGTCTSKSISDITDQLVSYSVSFTEYF